MSSTYFKYNDALIKDTLVDPKTPLDQNLSTATSNILPGSWSSIPATTTWEVYQPIPYDWRQVTPSDIYKIPTDPIQYIPEIAPGSQCIGCGQQIGTAGHCYNSNCYFNIKKLGDFWVDPAQRVPVPDDDLRGLGEYSGDDIDYNEHEYFRGFEKEIQVQYPPLAPSQYEQRLAKAKVIKEEKPKRTRYPSYKKNDRVQTPEGPGNVWSIDRDGIVCVELDKDPSILHEFEKKELKKIK